MENNIFAGALAMLSIIFLVNSIFHLAKLNDIKSVLFGLVLVYFGTSSLYSFLIFSRYMLLVPGMVYTVIILNEIGMILVTLSLQSLFIPGFSWNKSYCLLFLYPLIEFANQLPFYFLSFEKKHLSANDAITNNTFYFYNNFSFSLHNTGLVLFLVYLIIFTITRLDWRKFSPKQRKKALTGFIFFAALIVLMIIRFIYFDISIESHKKETALDYVIYHAIIYFFLLFFQILPRYFNSNALYLDSSIMGIQDYFHPLLKKLDTDLIQDKLLTCMNNYKIYRNEMLVLGDLAEKAGITTHQLSLYLNQHLNIKFNDYINSFRVNEAKQLLLSEKDKKIIEICYEVGFNTLSVFYKAFRKETGLPPKQWLKENSGS